MDWTHIQIFKQVKQKRGRVKFLFFKEIINNEDLIAICVGGFISVLEYVVSNWSCLCSSFKRRRKRKNKNTAAFPHFSIKNGNTFYFLDA